MKIILFLPILFLSFLSPVNSETNEKKEYSKYDFYSKCLDDALPRTMNNGLVYECSMKSKEKIDNLIQEKISSRGECDNEGFGSHACSLKRSQKAFKTYFQTECTWNKYGMHYPYCEMNLKKDRLIWLDTTLGT